MDDSLASYSVKGRRQWSLRLPASLTCMELLHHRPRSFKAVVVALQNREVRIYKDKFLVNCITVDVSLTTSDLSLIRGFKSNFTSPISDLFLAFDVLCAFLFR